MQLIVYTYTPLIYLSRRNNKVEWEKALSTPSYHKVSVNSHTIRPWDNPRFPSPESYRICRNSSWQMESCRSRAQNRWPDEKMRHTKVLAPATFPYVYKANPPTISVLLCLLLALYFLTSPFILPRHQPPGLGVEL